MGETQEFHYEVAKKGRYLGRAEDRMWNSGLLGGPAASHVKTYGVH